MHIDDSSYVTENHSPQLIEAAIRNGVTWPERPTRPTLYGAQPTAEQAREYANKLEVYEAAWEAYNTGYQAAQAERARLEKCWEIALRGEYPMVNDATFDVVVKLVKEEYADVSAGTSCMRQKLEKYFNVALHILRVNQK